jgi:cellulose synthase/poly-beta-1,6-N-acetylglucosamine synthase-like glycosyltransferase
MTWATLALLVVLVSLDMQNMASMLGRIIKLGEATTDDYTIVVPIFGDPKYFRNGDYLRRYRRNALLAVNVDSPKMEQFVRDLRAEGWRVHEAHLTGRVSCPELLCEALRDVTTAYVVRMDGDTVSYEDPGRAVAAARSAGADLCSVKITVSRRQTLIEKLQAVEYDMSMLGRHNRAWMTSGACMIAKTSSLRDILAAHSFWFPGEDLETGVIATHYRLSVRHLDMRFYTDAPPTFRTWFRQRRMWWSGSFRMAFINPEQTLRFPLTFIYTVCVVWLMWIAKWHELRDMRHVAAILPFIVLMYTGVCFLSNWSVRNRWMVVYPYYALFQVLVLPPLGALYYATSWYRNRTLKPPGRYRIGFRRETLQGDTGAVLQRAIDVVRESLPARSGRQVVEALRAK